MPTSVVSSKDAQKIWGKVTTQPLDGTDSKAAAPPSISSSPFLKADNKASISVPAQQPPSRKSSNNTPAGRPSSGSPATAASVGSSAPAPTPIASSSSVAPSVGEPAGPAPAESNISIKNALGLQKCQYCTKFCYDGEGEEYEGKLYHTDSCLEKASALIKSANEEAAAKMHPKKNRTPADPVINEILKTEEAYLSDLGLIITHFLDPCREQKIISDDDIKTIFCNVVKLKALHETVLVGLHAEAKKPAKIQNWGLVFKTYEASFRSEYQVYTKNQSKARARRRELEEEPRFKEFLSKALAHPDIRLTDLNSYLIKPVQRVCKYPLLLRELNKAFDAMGIANEDAKKDMSIAMNGMSEVLKKANDYMSTLRASKPEAGPPAAADVVGSKCTFCKKPVHPSERRMEDGLVYHAELCYNREKAAQQLEKKAKAKAAKPVEERADSTRVRRNPLFEQKAKVAARKAEKERLRLAKEEEAKKREEEAKKRDEDAALRDAERAREEVEAVKAKLAAVRAEQEKLEQQRRELERIAQAGMQKMLDRAPPAAGTSPAKEQTVAESEPQSVAVPVVVEAVKEDAASDNTSKDATPPDASVDPVAQVEKVPVADAAEHVVEATVSEPVSTAVVESVNLESEPDVKKDEPEPQEPVSEPLKEPELQPQLVSEAVKVPESESVAEPAVDGGEGEPAPIAEPVKLPEPEAAVERAVTTEPAVEPEVQPAPEPVVEELKELDPALKETDIVAEVSIKPTPDSVLKTDSKEESSLNSAAAAAGSATEEVVAQSDGVADSTQELEQTLSEGTAASTADSAPDSLEPPSESAISDNVDNVDDVGEEMIAELPVESQLNLVEMERRQKEEAEIILAAIDVEGDLSGVGLTAEDDQEVAHQQESLPEEGVPSGTLGDGQEPLAEPIPAPVMQFATLRSRRTVRAVSLDEMDPNANVAMSAPMPREVARTLRIIDQQREVFATIRARQIADDSNKAAALLAKSPAQGELGDSVEDVSAIAKIVAAEERDTMADTAHALEQRKMIASVDAIPANTQPLLDAVEKIEAAAPPLASSAVPATGPPETPAQGPTQPVTASPGPAVKEKPVSSVGPVKNEKRRSKIATFFSKKKDQSTTKRRPSGSETVISDVIDSGTTVPVPVQVAPVVSEPPKKMASTGSLLEDSPSTSRDPAGFYVEDANPAVYSYFPEPNPTDAVVRLAQTAVQVAHDQTKEVLNFLKEGNLFDVPDTHDNLLEDGGKFVAASLPKTIQLLSHHANVDIELLMCFLHTYGALMLPTDLVGLIRARWHMDAPAKIKDPEERTLWRKKTRKTVRNRIILFLRLWIKWHPRTFTSKSPVTDLMLVFLEQDVIPKVGEQGESIRKDLLLASQGIMVIPVMGEESTPLLPTSEGPWTLRDIHPTEVARQMALVTFDVYRRIHSAELLQRRWKMAHKTLLSPGVLNMQQHEHRVRNWFATQVLSEVERKKRAVILSRLILVAVESIKLHNFSGAVCIIEALDDPAIRRLKRTWNLIPHELIAEMANLRTLVDKENDFRMLVAEMSSTSVPGIPYIGAMLPRIEDIEDRLPYILNEKQRNHTTMLSLSKIRLVGTLVNQVMRFQTHAYNFKPVDSISKFLMSKSIDDLNLLRVSSTLEPEE